MNTKSNEKPVSDPRLDRIVAAVKAANVPDYVISGMMGRMPKGQWQVQQGGEKPCRELFCIGGLFTKNTAGAEGAWHAMMLRPGGASLSEVSYGFNCAAAHNHNYVGLSQGTQNRPGPGYFFRSTLGPSRWSMVFTAKGEKAIMQKLAGLSTAQPDKPAKASKPVTGKAKAKKATKVAPTQTPISEAPTVNVTPEVNQKPDHELNQLLDEIAASNPVTDQPVDPLFINEVTGEAQSGPSLSPAEKLAEHFNS